MNQFELLCRRDPLELTRDMKVAPGIILFKTYEQRTCVLRYSLTTVRRAAAVLADHFTVGSNE